jgi:Permuted papain-like amidase enzyme, YaeF/YiiX, C92 family
MPASIPLLPYDDVRPQIRSGDLLLCSGSRAMSRMIQHSTNSPYSHVAMLWRLENLERILVLESVESIGVRFVPLGHYINDYNHTGMGYPGSVWVARHAAFPVDPPPLTRFAQQAVDLLGTVYDTRELAGIALRIVSHKLGLPLYAPTKNTSLICSEFVQICLESIGIYVPYDARGFIAPADYATCPEVTFVCEIDTHAGS